MISEKINIHEAKTHLSKYARLLKRGRSFILCDRNKPFAEIRPLVQPGKIRRRSGLFKGLIHVPDEFNKPDPEMERLFNATPIFPKIKSWK